MATIPAYTINGFTRPALILDGFGRIVLDDTAAAFAQTYGIKALYLGCPPGTPYPPVQPSLLVPTDTNGAANTVAEGAAANTTVGVTAQSTSNLGFPVTYSLTADSSGGGFKINPTTGVVSVAEPSKIDFESSSGHSYSITVKANDGVLTTFRTFTIGVSDVAPTAPADANAGANTVAEGAANGTAVGVTLSATDVNGGAVTYSLTNNANGAFTINATTGVITVADSSKIDFESAPGHAYTVTARASDGTLSGSTQSFTINVTDVAPSTPTDSNNATNTVAEGAANGSTVGLTASSGDPNGPATIYSLTDNAGGRFAINSSTGVVTVANGAAIDFETAAGHAYGITVQATSGAISTTKTFSIGVTDVGPSVPTDTNGAADTVAEGAANGTTVGITVTSTDPGGGPAPTYSLTNSAGGRFAIDPNTGIVTVANGAAIDFESAAGHAYGITVQTQAGALTSTKNFSIGVSDVAPSTPVDANGGANTVAEGAANGTAVGVTVSATDVNGGPVTYSLTDSANGAFAINSTTGVITVADATKIDYETAPGHAYAVTAQASDGTLSRSQTFTIAVSDVAPASPVDSNGATNTIAEGAANGSTVGVTASSLDVNGPAVTYALVGDTSGGGFTINSTTGVITVADPTKIDFETAAGHAYTVTAQANDGTLTSSSAFVIAVTDVAPSTPADANGAANTVFEGAANGTTVGITATSSDPGGSPAPTYSLTDSAGGRFAIDANTGIVTVANGAAIDFESAAGHAYDVTVQATAGALSTTHTFTIGVGNVNEAPAGTDKAVLIAEDSTYTFGVADFGFSDPSDSSAPNSLLAVKITTLPGAGEGTLTNNGVAVNAGDSVSAADIAAGHLVFTPVLNANGSPEATFTFQVQDNGGTANGGVDLDQFANTFTINVTAGNDAPVNSVPGIQSVNEEATLTFSTGNGNAITLSDVDVGSGNATVTLLVQHGTLTLGSTAGLQSFINNSSVVVLTGTVTNINAALNGLTYTGNLNFNGADSLVVNTTDNGNNGNGGPQNDSDSITINVAPVNDAPVNGVPAARTVNEDTNLVFTGANAITISDVDAGSGDETVTLTVTSGTLALGSTLNLTSFTNNAASITLTGTVASINAALDGLTYRGNANFNGADSLSIATHDNGNTGGGDLTDTDSVTINVSAVNDAPSFTVGGSQTVLEDSGVHTVNGFITGISPGAANEAGQTVNFLTSNDNNDLFTVQPTIDASGNLTYTLAGNANGSATVTVQLHDNSGTASGGSDTSGLQTFTITAGPVNDAPAGTNNAFTILEDSSHTFTAAEFGFTDPVDDANSSGANAFQAVIITTLPGAAGTLTLDTVGGPVAVTVGQSIAVADIGSLVFTPAANANGSPEASFTFQVQDDGGTANAGVDTDQSANTITFNVTPVNDAPAGTTRTVGSQGAHTFVAADFGFTDPLDAAGASGANALQAVIITTIPDAGTGALTLNGVPVTAGQSIAVADIGGLVFTPVGNNSGSFDFQVQDNGGTSNFGVDLDPSANTLTIIQNVPPTVTAGDTLAYAENATSVIDPTITITDPDNANMVSARVAITVPPGIRSSEDELSFTPVGSITGSYDASTGVLSLSGIGTKAEYEQVLESVSYHNNSENPSTALRTVTYTVNDGTLDSAVATATINVTPVDDAPVTTASGGATAYVENASAVVIDGSLTVTDPDSFIASAQVRVSASFQTGDTLNFVNQNGITGVYTPGTGVLALSGTASAADYQAALRSITFSSTNDDPGVSKTIEFKVSAANATFVDSNLATKTLSITPVNDAPATTAGGTLNYTENQVATAIDASVTITDADSANLSGATVAITANYANGEDVLAFLSQNGITGTFNAATGILTLTGSSSRANYQAALDSVTYFNNSNNPSGLDRTVSYTVNDGSALSNTSISAIHVTPVNDAPVVTAGATATFTENGAAANVAGSLTLNDLDNTSLAGAIVSLTNAQVNDVLSVQGQAGTSGDLASGIHFVIDNSAHTVTFSNADTVTDYQAALRLVQFSNASEDPSATARSFTITADDGQAANHGGSISTTLAVVAVDDAPVNTIPADTAVPTAFSNTNTAISGISIADVDAGSGIVTTQLSVTNGTVAVTLAGSASISAGNNGTATLTLSGTVADINTTLANSVTFHSTDGFTGQANLTVVTNDQNHTGTGGPQSDTDVVHIGVVPQVWYIDNTGFAANGAGGSGTAADPFRSIADFNDSAGPGANDYIVIRTGTGTYTGEGLDLQNGQQVYGAGETLSFTNPVTNTSITVMDGTGTRPTISVTAANDQGIDLASNNTIHGVNIITAAGTTGLDDGSNSVGNLTIDHMTISGAGQAVDIDQGGALNVTLDSLSATGGTFGVQLAGTGATALSGSFVANGGAISGSTNSGFLVGDGAGGAGTGGTATISYSGTITTSNAASVVNIQDHSTGAVTLSGNLTHSGNGAGVILDDNSSNFTFSGASNSLTTNAATAISITDQTNSTVTFSGAVLDINTTTGTGVNIGGTNTNGNFNFTGGGMTIDASSSGNGFVSIGGGTVNVTGSGNHIASNGGTALNISNTVIGASHVTFHDISANGGTNGIVLNSTGTSGHLAVTGNGSVAQGGDSSGGTIQNTTGAGISLTSTLSPTLNNMNIQSTGGSGISGTDVTNFSFTNGTINNSGPGVVDASNIAFNSNSAGATNNVDGTITITNNVLSNAFYHGVDIQNRLGTIDNATISNNAITSATAQANAQGSGIHIVTFGTATSAANLTKATIDGNTIVNFPLGAGISVFGGNSNAGGPGGTMGVPNNATNVIAITNNNIHGLNTATPIGSEGIVAAVQGSNGGSRSQGNFNISGNTITDTKGQGIAMSGFGNSTVNAKVNNNTVDTNSFGKLIGSNGIGIGIGVTNSTSETPLMTVEVIGNTVTDYDGQGIRLVALNTNGTLNATVLDNAVGRAAGGGFPARIRVDVGNEEQPGNNTINLDIAGNTGIGTSVAADAGGIGLRVGNHGAVANNANVLRIEGLVGTSEAAVESYVAGKNPGMFAGTLNGAYNPAKIAEVIRGSTGDFAATAGNVPQPLLAVAGGVQAASPTPGETHLTQAQLDSVVAAAIAQWAHAGASASQLAALAAITFSVDDLAGNSVGEHTAGHIVVDADAAGHGWFVDPTPSDNSEFTHAANAAGTKLLTDPTNAAAGHLDLLTTVTHEMGHELGLPDLTAASDANELMYIDLVDGERRLPDAGDVPATNTTAANTPVVWGTPGNDTIDAGHGGKILVGGAGADNFVFANVDFHAATPWSLLSALWGAPPVTPPELTHVADDSFAQGDSFDFSALTSAFHGSWASDAQIVRAVEDPSGTFATLQVNAGGPSIASWFNMLLQGNFNGPSNSTASWVDVARLDGAHAGDEVSVLIDSHTVHLAQVHVGLLV